MKLTKEQIEAEMVKFEKWYVGDSNIGLQKDDEGNYAYIAVYHAFKTWLACRESIEITLNIVLCGHDSGYKRVYNEAIDDIKEVIELQGFTVGTL